MDELSFDWFVATTSEEFDALEHPKPIYVWDAETPDADLPPTLINADTYPELHETWTGGEYA